MLQSTATAMATIIIVVIVLGGRPAEASGMLGRLKLSLFGPSCSQYHLRDEYHDLLTQQLQLVRSAQSWMGDWSGPPRFTANEIRAAARCMQQVNRDPKKRRLARYENGVLYIAFKFWIMEGAGEGDTLLSSRLSVYRRHETQWAWVKRQVKMEHPGRHVVLTGYGLGGTLSVLTGLRLHSLHSAPPSIRVLTFDDQPLFLKDPDTDPLVSRLAHLRMLFLEQPGENSCSKTLFLHEHVDVVALPYERFAHAVDEAAVPSLIDYATYFDRSLPASIGTREGETIDRDLKRTAAHAALATPVYAANRRLIDKKRAKEAASKASAVLSTALARDIVCKPRLFRTIEHSFRVHCRPRSDAHLVAAAATPPLLDFEARLLHTKTDKREACRKMLAAQRLCPKTQSEGCVKELRQGSDGVRQLLFSCTHVDVDNGRLHAVLVPPEPLKDGLQLLDKLLLTPLINPSDPFPSQCRGLVQGARCPAPHSKLWQLSRLFFTTLAGTRSVLPMCRMASKRDSAHFAVQRVLFSVGQVSHRSLQVEEVKECLAQTRPVDCTDPINHWIRPRVCPARCKAPGKQLCKEVVACPRRLFVSVQQIPLLMGSLEGQLEPGQSDQYVAYHLRAREESFGFLGMRRHFHLVFVFG